MNIWLCLSDILTICAIMLLIWAALHDLAARTVPNALPAWILAIGIAIRAMDHSIFWGLLIAAIIFAVLFAFWFAGAVGGGDVKLWGASAVLIPPHFQVEFSCITRILLAGGGLGLLYLLLRLIVKRPRASHGGSLAHRIARVEAWRISRKGPLPYAFAIAAGTILTLQPFQFLGLR